MSHFTRINNLQTPSQVWARRNSACFAGRSALGNLSVGEYWRSASANPWNLFWVALHLKTANPAMQNSYDHTLASFNVIDLGRWKMNQTRDGLMRIMESHDVVLPAVLL